MKIIVKMFGIIVLAAVIGFAFAACDEGSNNSPGSNTGGNSGSNTGGNSGSNTGGNSGGNTNTNQTPIASDYNIANLDQKQGNVIAITITAKNGKSPGAISNIRYAGNTAVPQTSGTYAVYFAVAAATGWNAASDIFAGNLVVGYNIGDTGTGGGKVFFDKGSISDGWRYLEAASTNMSITLVWASYYFTSTNITGTGKAVGTGKVNTAAILAVDANAPAAKACADYRGGDKNDWFLPSIDELYEMYKVRTYLGISTGTVWSSTQGGNSNAQVQSFYEGERYGGNYGSKNNLFNVRAIRAF